LFRNQLFNPKQGHRQFPVRFPIGFQFLSPLFWSGGWKFVFGSIKSSRGSLNMKIVKVNLLAGLPFFICSLFAVLAKYTARGGGMFDLSELVVLFSFGFFGFVLLTANLFLFKRLERKQLLRRTWIHQAVHSTSYILLCITSNIFMKAYYSYTLAFLAPIIIIAFITTMNIILYVTIKPKNKESALDKKTVLAFILLLCVSIASTYHYYDKWNSCKTWAQNSEAEAMTTYA
jgi:hypothetical protein